MVYRRMITTVARHVAQCRVNRDFAGSSCDVGRARMHTGCTRPGGCACTARAVPVPIPPHPLLFVFFCRNERIRDPMSLSRPLSLPPSLPATSFRSLPSSHRLVLFLFLPISKSPIPLPRVNPFSGQRK